MRNTNTIQIGVSCTYERIPLQAQVTIPVLPKLHRHGSLLVRQSRGIGLFLESTLQCHFCVT